MEMSVETFIRLVHELEEDIDFESNIEPTLQKYINLGKAFEQADKMYRVLKEE